MAPFILLLFIALPIVELVVLIKIGAAIGALDTIGLMILSAIVGTALVRAQGLATLNRVRDSLARDIFPAKAVFDGICLLTAGILFIFPGFVSDAVGLLLVLPPVRALLRTLIWRYLAARGETRVWVNGEEVTPHPPQGPEGRPDGRADESGRTIEGSWHEVDNDRLEGRGPRR
jgi:UPF0716 protein FxsA